MNTLSCRAQGRLRSIGASLLVLLVLPACVVVPAHRTAYGGPPPAYESGPLVMAPMAPPPPRYEVVPALPYAGAVWIGGYWNWSGRAHVWVPGRWEAPRHGWRYEPRRWEPVARGGYALRGGWRNR
ncbi:MAG: YXWGXW repeat-containing protein [Burkholderiales bacterium]|nr:YXWGXW repeat-containing protein [Burkholderiales bacterium]